MFEWSYEISLAAYQINDTNLTFIYFSARKGMTRFGRSRTQQQAVDIDISDTKPIRKSSDDSLSSWRSSLVNSKMVSI